MTPEEEFIARLTCSCLTTHELWVGGGATGLKLQRADAYFVVYEDIYVTDANLFIPADTRFYFVLDDIRNYSLITIKLCK